MKNSKLIWILLPLLAGSVVYLKFIKNNKSFNTFDSNLFRCDTTMIASIDIHLDWQKDTYEHILLTKENNQWMVGPSRDSLYLADYELMKEIMKELSTNKAQSIVTSSKEDWATYEVQEPTDAKVSVTFSNGAAPYEIILGKLSQTGSFLRFPREEKVYAVDGVNPTVFVRSVKDFRLKLMLRTYLSEISEIQWNHSGDSSFVMKLSGTKWMIETQQVSNENIDQLAKKLKYQGAVNFIPSFNDSEIATSVLTIKKINGDEIEIKAWKTSNGYVLHSSMLKGMYVLDDGTIYNSIFVGKNSLLQ